MNSTLRGRISRMIEKVQSCRLVVDRFAVAGDGRDVMQIEAAKIFFFELKAIRRSAPSARGACLAVMEAGSRVVVRLGDRQPSADAKPRRLAEP